MEPQQPMSALRFAARLCLFFSLGAVCVGGISTVFWAASAFAHKTIHTVVQLSPFLPLVLTPLAFAVITLVTNGFFLAALGSGVPQTIAAMGVDKSSHRKTLLSIPLALAKLCLTVLGQACGASVGREGPMVQIGASVMYSFERLIPITKISQHHLERALIIAGSAAGIASTFNAPFTGIIFALEQLSKPIKERVYTFAAIVVAVAIAVATIKPVFGNYSYLVPSDVTLPFGSGWIIVLMAGAAGGLLGGFFSRAMLPANTPKAILRFKTSSPILFAALCGFCVAMAGILSGGVVYGNGSRESQWLLLDPASLPTAYGLLKVLATFFSCFSGIPGGLFAPSLGAGAGIGANLSLLAPSVPPAAAIMLGVAAYFSGVFRSPLTGVVVVVEMTGCYAMALPLMAATIIAAGISRLICKQPLYETIAERWRDSSKSNETDASK